MVQITCLRSAPLEVDAFALCIDHVVDTLPLVSEEALDQVHAVAPAWDRLFLAARYRAWMKGKRRCGTSAVMLDKDEQHHLRGPPPDLDKMPRPRRHPSCAGVFLCTPTFYISFVPCIAFIPIASPKPRSAPPTGPERAEYV